MATKSSFTAEEWGTIEPYDRRNGHYRGRPSGVWGLLKDGMIAISRSVLDAPAFAFSLL